MKDHWDYFSCDVCFKRCHLKNISAAGDDDEDICRDCANEMKAQADAWDEFITNISKGKICEQLS